MSQQVTQNSLAPSLTVRKKYKIIRKILLLVVWMSVMTIISFWMYIFSRGAFEDMNQFSPRFPVGRTKTCSFHTCCYRKLTENRTHDFSDRESVCVCGDTEMPLDVPETLRKGGSTGLSFRTNSTSQDTTCRL